MADFINPVFEILTCLCGYCDKRVKSIRKLGEELNSLRNASNQLNSMYLDVKMKVETAQQDPDPELMVLNVVKDWMGKVEDLLEEVQTILHEGDQAMQSKCFGGRCPKNCRARYKLYKVVTKKLNDVNDIISKGQFSVVAEKFAHDRFDELPVDKAVGIESTFEELRSCFEDNQVGIIGLYGMGGVGKTTLLRKFNNEVLSTKKQSVIIWVVASKDADLVKIQEDIWKKLHVLDDNWDNNTVEGRALLLYNILKKKNFVLLLDDVWKRIDLLKLGVPSPNNYKYCKILFTTRSKKVCSLMGGQRHIKVSCLTPDKAFELFKEKVDETTLEHPHILHLAKQVVEECKGLPLALCTVGRAMANVVTPNEWNRAVDILKSYPSRFSGIVEEVYHLLEFSYDRLPNNAHKSCFCYCSLFPEDHSIEKKELILLWIAEGFLAEFDGDIHEARKQGEDIISSLLYACLLENGDRENTIKMHDVVRDMALWVACDHGKKITFFVKDGSTTTGLEAYNHAKLKEIERLSLWSWSGKILNFSQKLLCPNLITMLIRGPLIERFPTEVFVLSSTIRVLDLSYNRGITNLPPTIGDFINLEHMNLSYTSIKKVPEELKNLKKLTHLLLNCIRGFEFPREIISNLSSLQVFSMFTYRTDIDYGVDLWLDELEGLDHLQAIHIYITRLSSIQKILISSKLQRCMCHLDVYYESDTSSIHELLSSLRKMEHLETLQVSLSQKTLRDSDLISRLADFEGKTSEHIEAANISRSILGRECTITLRQLTLVGCRNIVDLNWLIHAPNLEFLDVSECHSLVEVITEDFGAADTRRVESNPFSSLTDFYLKKLSELRSICSMALQFPCLKYVEVRRCPKLKKLPFDSQSALKSLQTFYGSDGVLDQLQWEDEATKHLLVSKFSIAG
ncbi:LOW QUALITY PROTEIN: probable disease resistance protein At1g61300 [Prosopis cineraria]|uniref:LOW QUALITY PROTEIN: probable disease resistance protein At1g61300 n=1 Tax=Prosopis cineraria TaxID=364024 RepID=UPI00240FE12F|nr:LOW QUALITY PROTEIN: probable disease resistance protein At1g61300 [Prosopis cineraria]